MPTASISSASMSQLVRDTYQANGLIRSHQQPNIGSSQTSLQKLPASSPQFLYQQFSSNSHQQHNQQQHPPTTQQHHQQQSMMQLYQTIPPPLMATQIATSKPESLPQFNQMVVPNPSQFQQTQQTTNINNLGTNSVLSHHSLNIASGANIGAGSNTLPQSTILMPQVTVSKNSHQYQQNQSQPQPQQQQQQQQHQHQQQQQQQQQTLYSGPYFQQQPQQSIGGNQAHYQQLSNQQQVPMTTIMVPANVASQLQSISMQIQQAAMQTSPSFQQNPQILVFMIPYMVNNQQHLTMPTLTPEQSSLNSTLVRQSHSNSSMMRQSHPQLQHQQQQQLQQVQTSSSSQSRAVSSLSNSTITAKQEPEKFYIKANFSYQASRNRQELSFQKGDILHVLDTLQNNDYGVQYWLATRVKPNGDDGEKGLIPNKAKAEEITIEQRTMNLSERGGDGTSETLEGGSSNSGGGGVLSSSVGRVNFLKRRSAQRSKSLCKDNWDNVVFDIGNFRMQTYERVVFKHPGFCRPVVIFGPLSDIAREKLLKDYPEKYSYPTGISQSPNYPKVIRLKGILDVIDQGKHALLDITAQAVERLNYVNLAPIVIFMKTESKSIIKEFRSRAAKSLDPNARDEDTLRRDAKSSRKLLEQSNRLEKQWFHVFTATLDLSTMGSEMWYRKLRETIENQQSANVWMGEKKSERKLAAAAAAAASNSNTATSSNLTENQALYSGLGASRVNLTNGSSLNNQQQQLQATTASCAADALTEKFNDYLNISNSKGASDLLTSQISTESGLYGNRSQLRNAYAHSLAQKLARASSEPKLNGLMSDNEDGENDDYDDDDDDEIIKKPLFPAEFENSSSISSSNGIGGGSTSFGQCSLIGTTSSVTSLQNSQHPQHSSSNYQVLPPVQGKPPAPLPPQVAAQHEHAIIGQDQHHHSHLHNQAMNRSILAQENIYSMNGRDQSMVAGSAFTNGVTNGSLMNHQHRSDYHTLPAMVGDNVYTNNQQHSQLQSGPMHQNNNKSNSATLQSTNGASNNQVAANNHSSGLVNNGSGNTNNNGSNNALDLTRNHDSRGSAFQIYSDMNQNSYHYYNINKI